MPPGLSFKTCPGCGFHNQIRVGSRDELQYFRVMLLDCDQKAFFCGVDCYQKYLQKTYGDSTTLKADTINKWKIELKQVRLQLAQEKEEKRRKLSNVTNPTDPTDPSENIDTHLYVTKRRASHANTKTNVIDIEQSE